MQDYLKLIWMGLSSSISFAFVGLLLGIGLVTWLYKRKLLERQVPFLKVVTKLYFLYFPIVFFFTCWFGGSLYTTANLLEKELTKVVTEIEQKTYPVFVKFVDRETATMLAGLTLPSNEEIADGFIAEYLGENPSVIYQYTMKLCLVTLLEYMIGKDREEERRLDVLSKGVSIDLFQAGFDVLKQEVKRGINQLLWFLLFPIIFGFLGAMLLPTIEIFIANKYLSNKN